MLNWYVIALCALLGGMFLSLLFTPFFRWVARKTNFMDCPKTELHKGHRKATPLLGGAAMFTSWLVALGGGYLAIRLTNAGQYSPDIAAHEAGLQSIGPRLAVVLLGALLIVLMGMWDDRKPLGAGTKFLGQFLVALLVTTWGGLHIDTFASLPLLNRGLTIFWYMLLFNAINFFDNMDGLAVGTVTIAMGLFATVAAINGQFFVASFAALNCGVGLGFWYYNHSPATIFMGDSGSHFLGYLAATTSILVSYYNPVAQSAFLAILIPFFILAVPLFDTAAVVLIRARKGKPFWIGDHNHISHRFEKMGLSRRCAVLLVHLLTLILGLGVLPACWGSLGTAAVLVAQGMLILCVISILHYKLTER